MAEIVLEGPKALEAVRALQKALGADAVLAWDLAPDIPNAVRVDVTSALTPAEAIQFVDRAAYENRWLEHEGWIARFMGPVESRNGVVGVPV